MKLFSISSTEKFLNLIKKSQGAVILHLPDGSQLDLKQSHTAQQIFQIMQPGQSGLHISLSDSADTPGFIRYMMEAGANS